MSKYRPNILKARLPLSMAFAAVLVFMVVFSTSAWANYPAVVRSFFGAACILVGIASLGRLWCSLYIAGYKLDRLVVQGPYSMCRNPLYFFSFIGMIGCGLATGTFSIPLLVVFFFAVYYPLVIRSEEIELRKNHGRDLDAYLAATPAFFPEFSLLSEPAEYVVNPRVFRNHIFDAIWFVWVVGFLAFIEAIHELHVIPVLFKLY